MDDFLSTPGLSDHTVSLRVADHMSAPVRTISAGATLLEAARHLAQHGISCLVVMEGDSPAGMVSERDLVRLVAENPTDWAGRKMSAVMSHPLYSTDSGASVSEAIATLARHHIRRLPALSTDGRLAGIVTQTDLLRAAHEKLQNYATELERLVQARSSELRDIEQRRDDLVDLTVHDVKNSLCVVDSALEMLAHEPRQVDTVLPLLRRVTSRIGSLICTLLDVSRLQSGSMPLRVQEVPWSALCEPILAEMRLTAEPRRITLRRTGESHAIVRCDPSLVERILLNLLDNAITAAPDGTTVDVHATPLADGFLMRVGNRGRAIAPDVLPTLFSKYEQGGGNAAPLRRFGGWGLGLTFCRLAIDRHGGSIRAVSPYVDGEGAAFEFIVPAADAR